MVLTAGLGRPCGEFVGSFLTLFETGKKGNVDSIVGAARCAAQQTRDEETNCDYPPTNAQQHPRFVGVSRQEMFSTLGVWCESQKFGIALQNRLNAEIEMGFTEPWPRGVRCG